MSEMLRGLTVVVTRPAHQAGFFQRQLEQAGANVVLFPLIEIAAVENPAAARAVLAGLHTYDLAVFISANAVIFGLELLDGAQRGLLHALKLGAIGKKTAGMLWKQGFGVELVPAAGFTSEDFLALPEIQQLAGRRILIFRGEGGRELLADVLRRRGAEVDYVEVYRRICPENAASQLKRPHESQQIDIIAITSSEGLMNLLALLDNPAWIKTFPLLVGGRRMADTARSAGFTGSLIIADNPGDEAMLSALMQWAQELKND